MRPPQLRLAPTTPSPPEGTEQTSPTEVMVAAVMMMGQSNVDKSDTSPNAPPEEPSVAKIKVAKPVGELAGGGRPRIVWRFIKDELILPYLDIELEYSDLGIEHRDAPDDQV